MPLAYIGQLKQIGHSELPLKTLIRNLMGEQIQSNNSMQKQRLLFTAIISSTIWLLLTWEYFNGGIPSHHLLHRSDLPAISNAWGGIVLPVVSWFLLGLTLKDVNSENKDKPSAKTALVGFIAAVIYGGLLSFTFVNGIEALSGILFPGVLVLALFFKLYRAECILGFIVSMMWVFGAILPTIFGFVTALAAFIIYSLSHYIARTALMFFGRKRES